MCDSSVIFNNLFLKRLNHSNTLGVITVRSFIHLLSFFVVVLPNAQQNLTFTYCSITTDRMHGSVLPRNLQLLYKRRYSQHSLKIFCIFQFRAKNFNPEINLLNLVWYDKSKVKLSVSFWETELEEERDESLMCLKGKIDR